MADKCEAYFNGDWHTVDMETALQLSEVTKRCVECKGQVRIHKKGGKTPAHAEHRRKFEHCSLSFYYDGGRRKINPNQPKPNDVWIELLPGEELDPKSYQEGKTVRVLVNKYERDIKARNACLKKHKYTCKVCDVNLEDVYGEVAHELIHVHHITQLASIKKEYKVNPETDLVPVCPNCHSVLHRRRVPYTVEEVRHFLKVKSLKKASDE
jgi:hypothetical protein